MNNHKSSLTEKILHFGIVIFTEKSYIFTEKSYEENEPQIIPYKMAKTSLNIRQPFSSIICYYQHWSYCPTKCPYVLVKTHPRPIHKNKWYRHTAYG